MLDLKTLTAVLAVLTLTATATPATQGKTGVLCGKCYPDPNFIYGGSVMEFKSNPGKCGRFVPGFGWGPGKCRNEHCDLCMFFKDENCRDLDLVYNKKGSAEFNGRPYYSYSCSTK